MRKLVAAVTVCLFIVAPPVASAPKAQSSNECRMYADLGLVAAAAAKAGVERPKVEAMLPEIYDLNTDDIRTLAGLIVAAVYGSAKGKEPTVFAGTLGATCMRSKGDMDPILGTGS